MGVAASRRNLRRKIAALTGTTEHERLQHAVDRCEEMLVGAVVSLYAECC